MHSSLCAIPLKLCSPPPPPSLYIGFIHAQCGKLCKYQSVKIHHLQSHPLSHVLSAVLFFPHVSLKICSSFLGRRVSPLDLRLNCFFVGSFGRGPSADSCGVHWRWEGQRDEHRNKITPQLRKSSLWGGDLPPCLLEMDPA